MKSYGEPVTLSCPIGHSYRALAWRIIHAGEHPELLPAVEDGSIARPACPECGRSDQIIAESLLLFLPQASRPLVFSPMRKFDQAELQEEFNSYMSLFRKKMGDEWNDDWVKGSIPVVPRPNLPGYLKTLLGPGETLNQLSLRAWNSHDAFRAGRDPADLNAAVAAWEQAIRHPDFAEADAETRVPIYMVAAEDLRFRYAADGREEDFQRGLEVMRAAAGLSANRFSTNIQGSMGLLQLEHYSKHRDFGSITEATVRLEAAVVAQDDGETRMTVLFATARAWRSIFNELNIPMAIDRSIELLRMAVAEAAEDFFAAEARNRLGDALDKRHQRFARVEDLDEAERLFAWVIENAQGEPQLACAYNGRGCVLLDRYGRTGQIKDLNDAVPDLQRALRTEPEEGNEAATYWIDLGNGLRTRYEVYGDPLDLDEAIRAQRRSIQISTANGLSPQVAMQNLAVLTGLRFQRSGRLADLNDAIDFGEACLVGTPAASQHEAAVRLTLGGLLCARYQLKGEERDLQRGVDVLQTAQHLGIVAAQMRPSLLAAVGEAQLLTYRRTRDPKLLESAVSALREACESGDASTAVLPSSGSIYAAALTERYEISHDLTDLDRAIQYARKSFELLPADSTARLRTVVVLAECLEERAEVVEDEAARQEAVRLYRDAAGAESEPETVLRSARRWARLEFERGNWSGAAEASDRLLEARAQLLAGQAPRSDKETWLKGIQGASAIAAYAFARTGSLEKAAAALEGGAAILLSEALGEAGRADERLRAAGQNELADLLRDAESRLAPAGRISGLDGSGPGTDEREHEATIEPQDVVARIRSVPGFENFRTTASSREIQAIAAQYGGPLIYLATTSQGGLALVVSGEKIYVKWLEMTDRWIANLLFQQSGDNSFHGYVPAVLGMGGPLEPALTDTLRALEERLQKPLREEIAGSGWTRIALILTGRLALLPIPAGLLDDACVTVQANARALAASMAESHRSNRKVTALVVGNPLPTLNPLPGAEMEAAIVARYFSVSTVMTGAAVERDKVIDALKDASHLHFACHGLSESADPLSSALYLGEEKLMVRDLLFGGAAPTNARLATLSACQSAIPDIARLPDEMIGLPLAFLQASVPGVVGTLWPVSDLSTAALMNRFYAEYLEQSAPPDEALSRAQRWLRDVTAAELAEYFRVERSKPEAERVAPYETLSAAWRRFVALEPDTAPFRSPTYWAAFVYYGS